MFFCFVGFLSHMEKDQTLLSFPRKPEEKRRHREKVEKEHEETVCVWGRV